MFVFHRDVRVGFLKSGIRNLGLCCSIHDYVGALNGLNPSKTDDCVLPEQRFVLVMSLRLRRCCETTFCVSEERATGRSRCGLGKFYCYFGNQKKGGRKQGACILQ